MLAYTSGTTGHPKGVMHSHIAIRNTLERSKIFGYSSTDVHINYLPMFHIYAFSEIAMACVFSGGKQILTEIFDAEQALDLAVASIVAYPDPRLTEVPVAFVILKPGQVLEEETILARMKGRIASFKIPRHIIFVVEFPMTSSGKIRKVEQRAQAQDILGNA